MYHIAVVEDERACSGQLQDFLKQYQEEKSIRFKVSVFYDGTEILEGYQPVYDLILLDIEMPGLNGMDAAVKIREMDPDVALMFITNLAGYALHGYEVEALDFVTKPVTYYRFAMRLARCLKRVRQRESHEILLSFPGGAKKLDISQIYYVEVQSHHLHYHTDEGEFTLRGTMQSAEELLSAYSFVKCNHWYMVNLKHVSEVRGNTLIVGGHELEISRRSRAAFLKSLAEYVGGMH